MPAPQKLDPTKAPQRIEPCGNCKHTQVYHLQRVKTTSWNPGGFPNYEVSDAGELVNGFYDKRGCWALDCGCKKWEPTW